jgi:hypothetical protein
VASWVCIAKASESMPRRELEIRLLILDPLNVPLWAMYSEYRSTIPRLDGTGELWTTDRTQKESFATVLAAGWHRRSYGLLNISVFLMQQARQVIIEGHQARLTAPLTEAKVRQFFIDVGVPLPDSFTGGDVRQIIQKATHAKNPYA